MRSVISCVRSTGRLVTILLDGTSPSPARWRTGFPGEARYDRTRSCGRYSLVSGGIARRCYAIGKKSALLLAAGPALGPGLARLLPRTLLYEADAGSDRGRLAALVLLRHRVLRLVLAVRHDLAARRLGPALGAGRLGLHPLGERAVLGLPLLQVGQDRRRDAEI